MAVTQSTDTPSTNFCTLQPLRDHRAAGSGAANLKLGNTKCVQSGGGHLNIFSTQAVNSGKWHVECTVDDMPGAGSQFGMGIHPVDVDLDGGSQFGPSQTGAIAQLGGPSNSHDGKVSPDSTGANAVATITAGDATTGHTLAMEVNLDDNQIEWFNNAGSSLGTYSFTPVADNSGYYYFMFHMNDDGTITTNFGESTFTHTPSSGFTGVSAALMYSGNSVTAPTIDDGSLYFQNARWNGTNKSGLVVNTAETLIHMTADASGSGIHSNDVDSLAVLFQPKKTGPITRAGFQALNTSGAANSGNFVNAIYEIQGGTASAPDGTNLTNGQITGITGNDGDYIYGTFPNGGPIVEANKNYWLKLSHSSGSWACTHDVAGDDLVLGQGNNLLQGSTLQTTRSTNHQIYQGPGTLADGTASKEYPASTFAPDWVWMANRDDDGDNRPMYDTVRGVQKRILSNSNADQDTDSTGLTAFSSTGFTVSTRNSINNIKKGHIGWMWAAGGAPTTDNVSNSGSPGQTPTDGSVFRDGSASTTAFGSADIYPTRASINSTSGMSIIAYESNDAGAGTTVAHGLSAAPSLVMQHNLDSDDNWYVLHTDMHAGSGNTGNNIYLDLTNGVDDNVVWWNRTNPSSTVVTLGAGNGSGSGPNEPANESRIMYCFVEIPGFSQFGKYTGNNTGSNHLGPIVYTGFKPAWVLVKRTGGTEGWHLRDSARNQDGTGPSASMDFAEGAPGNHLNPPLIQINGTDNEDPGWSSNSPVDFLSNGFIIQRGSSGAFNTDGGTWIYMAFAECPFAGSTPAPAC